MDFANILKELRNDKGLTHKQLADKIGYSRSIIGHWENGQREPTGKAIIELANFFDVSTDFLLGREDESGRKISISNSFNNNSGKINFKG